MNTTIDLTNIKRQLVVGLAFQLDEKKIILIKKKRPKFQVGKLNGVGGHIESHESPINAMIREFMEETGIHITTWRLFCKLIHDNNLVYFFSVFSSVIHMCSTTTDEEVHLCDVGGILKSEKLMYNLKWLIPMALDPANVTATVIDPTPTKW